MTNDPFKRKKKSETSAINDPIPSRSLLVRYYTEEYYPTRACVAELRTRDDGLDSWPEGG